MPTMAQKRKKRSDNVMVMPVILIFLHTLSFASPALTNMDHHLGLSQTSSISSSPLSSSSSSSAAAILSANDRGIQSSTSSPIQTKRASSLLVNKSASFDRGGYLLQKTMDPEEETAAICVRSIVNRSSKHDRDMYTLDPSLASDRLRQEPCIKQLLESEWHTRYSKDGNRRGSVTRINGCTDCRSNDTQDIAANLAWCLSLRNENCCSCLFRLRPWLNAKQMPTMEQGIPPLKNGTFPLTGPVNLTATERHSPPRFFKPDRTPTVISNQHVFVHNEVPTETGDVSVRGNPITAAHQKPVDLALEDIQRRLGSYAPKMLYSDPNNYLLKNRKEDSPVDRFNKQSARSPHDPKTGDDIQNILLNPIAWINKLSKFKQPPSALASTKTGIIGLIAEKNKLSSNVTTTTTTVLPSAWANKRPKEILDPFPHVQNIALAAEKILRLLETKASKCGNKTKMKDCILHYSPNNQTAEQTTNYFKRLENRLRACQQQLEFCSSQVDDGPPSLVKSAGSNNVSIGDSAVGSAGKQNSSSNTVTHGSTTELQGQVFVAGVPVGFALQVPTDPVTIQEKPMMSDADVYSIMEPYQGASGPLTNQENTFFMSPEEPSIDEHDLEQGTSSLTPRDAIIPAYAPHDDMKSRVFQNFMVQVPVEATFTAPELTEAQIIPRESLKADAIYSDALAQKILDEVKIAADGLEQATTKLTTGKDPLLALGIPEVPIMASQQDMNSASLTHETVEDLFKKIDEFKAVTKKALLVPEVQAAALLRKASLPASTTTTITTKPSSPPPTTATPSTTTSTTTTTTTTIPTTAYNTVPTTKYIPLTSKLQPTSALSSAEKAMKLLEELDKKLSSDPEHNRTELLNIYETLRQIRIRVSAKANRTTGELASEPTKATQQTTLHPMVNPIGQTHEEDSLEPTRIVTVIEYVTDDPDEEQILVKPTSIDIEQMAKEAADERFFTKKTEFFDGIDNEAFYGAQSGLLEGDKKSSYGKLGGNNKVSISNSNGRAQAGEALNEVMRVPYDKKIETHSGRQQNVRHKHIMKQLNGPQFTQQDYYNNNNNKQENDHQPRRVHAQDPLYQSRQQSRQSMTLMNPRGPEPNQAMFQLAKAYRNYASKLQPRKPVAVAAAAPFQQEMQRKIPNIINNNNNNFKGAVEQKNGLEKHYGEDSVSCDIPMYHEDTWKQGVSSSSLGQKQYHQLKHIKPPPPPQVVPPRAPAQHADHPAAQVQDPQGLSLGSKPRGSRASKEFQMGWTSSERPYEPAGDPQAYVMEQPPDYYDFPAAAGVGDVGASSSSIGGPTVYDDGYGDNVIADGYESNSVLYDSSYVPDMDLGNSVRVRRSKPVKLRANGMANKLKKKLEEEAREMMKLRSRTKRDVSSASLGDSDATTSSSSSAAAAVAAIESTTSKGSSTNSSETTPIKSKLKSRKNIQDSVKRLGMKLPTVWIFKDKSGNKTKAEIDEPSASDKNTDSEHSTSLTEDSGSTTSSTNAETTESTASPSSNSSATGTTPASNTTSDSTTPTAKAGSSEESSSTSTKSSTDSGSSSSVEKSETSSMASTTSKSDDSSAATSADHAGESTSPQATTQSSSLSAESTTNPSSSDHSTGESSSTVSLPGAD